MREKSPFSLIKKNNTKTGSYEGIKIRMLIIIIRGFLLSLFWMPQKIQSKMSDSSQLDLGLFPSIVLEKNSYFPLLFSTNEQGFCLAWLTQGAAPVLSD